MHPWRIAILNLALFGGIFCSAAYAGSKPHGNGFWDGAGWYEIRTQVGPGGLAVNGPWTNQQDCLAALKEDMLDPDEDHDIACNYYANQDGSVIFSSL